MVVLDAVLPPDVPMLWSCALVIASFMTSAITAAAGLGGGVLLITIMANIIPLAALVPVHGGVQIGSNAGRALVQARHVDPLIALWFASGAGFGAATGGIIAVELPGHILEAGIGVFVLWIVWGRAPELGHARKPAMAAAGFFATFLSMFFGASGPIGGAVLSVLGLSRHQFVANQAITALIMHVLKLAAFGLLGFSFAPWLGLIGLMIASGFMGTLAGSRWLGRMNETAFKRIFKIVMTLLAGNLLFRSASAFLSG